MKSGKFVEAVARFKSALKLDPSDIDLCMDLARCYWRTGDFDLAEAALLPAVEREPGNLLLTSFLVDIYMQTGNWTRLHKEMLRRAHVDYVGAELTWELCGVNLLLGVMPEGWDQHEFRWEHKGLTNPKREFPQPRWNGETFAGRTLLLHFEQGFGDTLMFVRYAPIVKQLGGRVLLLAQRPLADLVATCPGLDQVIAEGDPLPPFDVHLPLLSLPFIFRTTLDTVPATIPYLDVPGTVPNRSALRELLARSKGRTRVGLSWAGSLIHVRNSQRSIRPDLFAPLAALPNVTWHSFQLGTADLPSLPDLVTLAPLLANFSDTAYALSGMDLLITVDTALAHLAGAMGIPTLLLVSYLPDWRWLLGREDSPWYPNVRIYRQTRTDDWTSVIHQVLSDLA